MKQCERCGKEKEYFKKNRNICLDCMKAYNAEYYKKNKEKAQYAKYYEKRMSKKVRLTQEEIQKRREERKNKKQNEKLLSISAQIQKMKIFNRKSSTKRLKDFEYYVTNEVWAVDFPHYYLDFYYLN